MKLPVFLICQTYKPLAHSLRGYLFFFHLLFCHKINDGVKTCKLVFF